MENNRVLDKSTALSKGTIFSALRQNLVRQMLNTSRLVNMEKRIAIIERFVQLMVNSGHKFQFIRAVVQQAITKYLYMVHRSQLDQEDKMYQPLYRPPNYKSAERIMKKFVGAFIWYKNIDLGDEFRQSWKLKIKTKTTGQNNISTIGSLIKRKRESTKRLQKSNNQNSKFFRPERDTTTAIFVPPTSGGKLSQLIQGVEEELSQDTGWKMKIVESSGTPIVQSLKSNFVMEEGCVLGAMCRICENTGVGCSAKNVVYSAECMLCSSTAETIHTMEQYEDEIYCIKELYQDVISESKEQYQDVISSLTPQHQNAASNFKEQHQDVISNCPLEDLKLPTKSSEHLQDRISKQTLEAVEFSGTPVDFDAKKRNKCI